MRISLPAWTPLVLVAVLVLAWPVAGLLNGGPTPSWVHSDEGDPVAKGDPVNAAATDVAAELAQVGVTSVGLETAPWRGTERATDNPASTSSGSKIKLVYAYGADQPDRFADYASLIQTDAKAIAETVAATSGGTKTLRFDTGTDGGAGYVDVASVRLPQPLSYYRSLSASDRSAAVKNALAATVKVNGVAHYAVYADGLYADDGVAGIAEMYLDERKSTSNLANRDNLWAFVWGDGGATFSTSHRTTLLHEITHTLGGVQRNAPHATTNGHCSDQRDVMCYDDGGLKPGQALTQVCAAVEYDCGGDDYFNPAPAAGSYLATNWNVYDSSFLCAPSSCVSGGPTNVAPEGPIDESGPTLVQPQPAVGATSSPVTSSPPPKARTRADRAIDALLASYRRALRRGVPSRLNLSFSAPARGRLRLSLKVGSHRAAAASRHLRTGRTRVVLKVSRSARRRYARGAGASLSVTFTPTTGRAASAHAAVSRG